MPANENPYAPPEAKELDVAPPPVEVTAPAPPTDEPTYCEVCKLPHRSAAVVCEECGHRLGTAPDFVALHEQRDRLRIQFVLGIVASVVIAFVSVSAAVRGGVIVWLLPFAWTARTGYRYRAVAMWVDAMAKR